MRRVGSRARPSVSRETSSLDGRWPRHRVRFIGRRVVTALPRPRSRRRHVRTRTRRATTPLRTAPSTDPAPRGECGGDARPPRLPPRALHREQPPAAASSGRHHRPIGPAARPPGPPPSSRRPTASRDRAVVGPAAHHSHLVAQPERLRQPRSRNSSRRCMRLDQVDLQVRAAERQHQAGQAGAAADVDHPRVLGQQLGQHGAVQQVPLPQPRHLARADQAARRRRRRPAARRSAGPAAAGPRRRAAAAGGGRRRHRSVRSRRRRSPRRRARPPGGCGSSPSDSLRTPSIAAIASCTTLRSNGFIGDSRTGLAAVQHLRAAVSLGERRSSSRRACR